MDESDDEQTLVTWRATSSLAPTYRRVPHHGALPLTAHEMASVVGAGVPGTSRATPPAPRPELPTPPPPAIEPEPRPEPEAVTPKAAIESPLFRHEALRAHQQGRGLAAPLDVAPLPSRVLFLSLFVLVMSALAVAFFGRVELTSLGRGVLREPEGVQPISAPVAGLVAEVLVEPGSVVAPGQPILRIASPDLRARLLEAEQKLKAVRERHDRQDIQVDRAQKHSLKKLEKRRKLLNKRIVSQKRGLKRLEHRTDRFRELVDDGLSAETELETISEASDQAERAVLALEDELARVELEMGEVKGEAELRPALRDEELKRATADRDAVRTLLESAEVRAARHGKIEGLSVSPGQQVQAGTLLARLVPLGLPRRAVAFLPEKDRAFVREGQVVRLEIDRLPVGEFGSIGASVQRISSDVADQDELMAHLGSRVEGVFFRLDLALGLKPDQAKLTKYLRSGTLLTVRAPLRSRRLLSLMFDPVRRWAD